MNNIRLILVVGLLKYKLNQFLPIPILQISNSDHQKPKTENLTSQQQQLINHRATSQNIMKSELNSVQLQPSRSTSSLQSLPKGRSHSTVGIYHSGINKPFEYEDLIYDKKSSIQPYKLTDILARESDVTISNQISPLTEYKGYSLYLIVSLFHIVWLIWTFTPKPILNKIGIYYYPSRWWSLCASSVLLMGMLYTYLALMLWTIEYKTVKLSDLRTIIDDDAVVEPNIDKYGWEVTSGVYDLRITDVNKVLYD